MGRWVQGAAAVAALAVISSVPGQAAPFLPDFGSAVFPTAPSITNTYFPLTPGKQYRYRSEATDGGETVVETSTFTVTHRTRTIGGVRAVEVRDRVFEGGTLIEDTRDWFAQDLDGNVWYLGEASLAFLYDDDGNFLGTSTAGSWQAGVNGALPGFIMEASPAVGDNYYQEFAPLDAALDQAIVGSLSASITTVLGSFTNVLRTLEFTELEPNARGFKFYAPGIGVVLEQDLDENFVPIAFSELIGIRQVPEPGLVGLLVAGMTSLLTLARRNRARRRVSVPSPC